MSHKRRLCLLFPSTKNIVIYEQTQAFVIHTEMNINYRQRKKSAVRNEYRVPRCKDDILLFPSAFHAPPKEDILDKNFDFRNVENCRIILQIGTLFFYLLHLV